MSNRLHQINMEYRAEEDRVVLKINTTDRKEVRVALTRRFVRQFWDSLQTILAAQPAPSGLPATPPERKAMVAFRAERAAPEESFRDKFEGGAEFPLGTQAVLAVGFDYAPPAGATPAKIAFVLKGGAEIGMPVNETILHSIVKLLQAVNERSGWDLRLEAGYATDEPARPPRLN
jgi:hypothetical protein